MDPRPLCRFIVDASSVRVMKVKESLLDTPTGLRSREAQCENEFVFHSAFEGSVYDWSGVVRVVS